MKNPFKEWISWEIGIWFLILAVLPLAVSVTIARNNSRNLIVTESTNHLRDIVHEKIERIELYVEDGKQSVRTLAAVPEVVHALRHTSRHFAEHGLEPSRLPELAGEAQAFLHEIQLRYGYHDIFLINRAGDIVYTLAREKDLGTNLRQGPYKESGLAWVFDKAITLLDSEISPFVYYLPSERSAAFIAAPVLAGNEVLGAVAIQLNEDRLFYIFTDYIGLGKSGELVAGRLRADGAVIAAGPLRNRPDALEKGLVFKDGAGIPIHDAVLGRKGAGLTIDYRGREVVAAWDYVPSLNWGLVVKIDRAEAFASIYQQDLFAGALLLAALLLVLNGIWLATKRITDPIKKLTATVKDFAGGDFKARAEEDQFNEVGLLAKTFNEMAKDIEEYSFSMEIMVAGRTEELAKAGKILERAQKIAHIGSWEWDIVNNGLVWSNEIYRIFGLEPQQFAATYEAFLEAVHPDDRELVTGGVEQALANVKPYEVDHRVVRPDGTIRMVHEVGEIKRDDKGQPISMLGTVQDVTQLRQAQRQLYQYISIVDENVITSATDLEGAITYASNAFCRISGYGREELLGQNHRILRHPEMPASLYDQMWETIMGGAIWRGSIKNKTKDDRSYWVELSISPTFDEMGKITGYTAIHNDITDKKKIEELSITDALTGLYNRRHFNTIIGQELKRTRRDDKNLAFIMFDVDHFKQYNDTYGHQKGDEVLALIGSSLKEVLRRPSDFGFRLGGEEFGIIAEDMTPEAAVSFADKYRLLLEGRRVEHEANSAGPYVTVSMGVVVVSPAEDLDEDEIFKKADDALYKAKDGGRNRVQLA
ncbi:MAG: diguanylate cyclase [Desulfobulbaceae bacterium]|nr:diguanylate cyclase [Desulfobulbaceae bacterium]HIJ80040.1 diguanylate cyclase [Deltaproteobacteria bacterium]